MRIQMRKLSDIVRYERNPRTNDQAVDAVARSIQEFGFRQPIVVDGEGVIVVGHTRFLAAKKLGLKKVPTHVAGELSPEQIKAYRLADNKLGELAEWDLELLPEELAELEAMGFDLDVIGFSDDELAQLLGDDIAEGLTDPDEVPLPPDEPITRPGDLYLLGDHRLMCGDAGSDEDVDRLLDGAAVHLVNTDPPYNVRVEPRSNNAIAAGLSSFDGSHHHKGFDAARRPKKPKTTRPKLRPKDRPLANDFVTDEQFEKLLRAWFGNIARVLEPGRSLYAWGGYSNLGNYTRALADSGLHFSQCIVWHKQHPVLTRKDFLGDFELCFYCWREGAAHRFFGPPNVTDVWSVKKVNPASMIHLTEKPVELAVRAIQYSSRKGEHLLDVFAGSGSTLVAAEQTARRAFLMEVDALYCDVLIRRWEAFTGKKAQRAAKSRRRRQEKAPSGGRGAQRRAPKRRKANRERSTT